METQTAKCFCGCWDAFIRLTTLFATVVLPEPGPPAIATMYLWDLRSDALASIVLARFWYVDSIVGDCLVERGK